MTAGNRQIIDLYEIHGLNAEQIAESLDLDTVAVKCVLQSDSVLFRKETSKDPTLVDISEVAEAKKAIVGIMRYTEDDNLRMRAARFIFDEGKGRHNIIGTANLNVNVHLVNDQLARARQALDAARTKIIDVPSHVIQQLADAETPAPAQS